MPKKGRGQYKLLGEYLNIGSVVTSQVFNGDKELTPDQAFLCAEFLGLNDLEREFFILLVNYSRASHYKLKDFYSDQIKEHRKKALSLSSHMKKSTVISDEAKQIFYSDWSYSAISLATCIDKIKSADDVARYLKLDLIEVKSKLNFLLQHNLVVEKEDGLALGTGTTFLDKKSPLLNSHRKNWRIKGMEDLSRKDSLFLVAPLCLSKKLRKKLHANLLKVINETLEDISKEDAEELVCLNIDLFPV